MAIGRKAATKAAALLRSRLSLQKALVLVNDLLDVSKNKSYQRNLKRIRKALKKADKPVRAMPEAA